MCSGLLQVLRLVVIGPQATPDGFWHCCRTKLRIQREISNLIIGVFEIVSRISARNILRICAPGGLKCLEMRKMLKAVLCM